MVWFRDPLSRKDQGSCDTNCDRSHHQDTGGSERECFRHENRRGCSTSVYDLKRTDNGPEGKSPWYHRDHAWKGEGDGGSPETPGKSLGEETHCQRADQSPAHEIDSQVQAEGPQGVASHPADDTCPGDAGRNIEKKEIPHRRQRRKQRVLRDRE